MQRTDQPAAEMDSGDQTKHQERGAKQHDLDQVAADRGAKCTLGQRRHDDEADGGRR